MPQDYYTIQTTLNPGVWINVDAAEYELLSGAGLIEGVPIGPQPAGIDSVIAGRISDTTSQTYAAGRSAFTLRATTLPPTAPAIGDVWIS